MATKIKIKLIRSPIGSSKRQRATVESLGLRRMQQTVEQPNNHQIRGMIQRVSHLLEIAEAD